MNHKNINTHTYLHLYVQDNAIITTVLWMLEKCMHIKTHGSESRGQGGNTLRRPLDERT